MDSQMADTNTTKTRQLHFFKVVKTSNNQRLGSAFDDLDPRLSLLCQVVDDVIHPCKICGGCQIRTQDPFIHCCWPIQS